MNPIDIVGQKFGRLTVLKQSHKKQQIKKNGNLGNFIYYYICKCDCGNTCIVEKFHLKYGHTQSCGCLKKEKIKKVNLKHGLEKSRLYHIWQGIKKRCLNPKEHNYSQYGAIGIKICDEWKENSKNFIDWALANGYQDSLTIDRIDVNGNYEPSNCRWVNMKTQCRNRRNSIKISYQNEELLLIEWCEKLNLKYKKVYLRLKRYNWSIEKALSTP